ncbi:putative mitochondrial protein [Cucumis melo var. makuwa]|uniref:Mitochondrial protein n=1 Tax=Cucumis melo var. makuwa TaxID=1194695 RepID=A0A5A7THQ3_CUCMM|nr:putative mitochondrial protein [Cucumis melo var. makuwa]TYK17796.1 putative mitochondrial protein [Cucumis melo var. makuwa]
MGKTNSMTRLHYYNLLIACLVNYVLSLIRIRGEAHEDRWFSKLPPHLDVKPLKSILGYVGFCRRFIKGFSRIAKPLSNLLYTDQSFISDEKYNQMFQTLKDALTSVSILITPDWSQPFVLMCDASDVVGHAGSKEGQSDSSHILLEQNP